MKKLIILMMLTISTVVFGADISNLTELKNAASTGGTFTIAPSTYTLDADLTFGTDITLTHDNATGDVIVDGNDAYKCIVDDCTATFTGQSNTKRIILTQGDDRCIDVQSSTSATVVEMTYCVISESNTSDGMRLQSGPADTIDVTLTDCNVYNNHDDGLSIEVGTWNSEAVLNVTRCEVHDNGSGASDQGITAHEGSCIVNVKNSNIYDNYDQGIAIVGSAQAYIYDCNILDSGGEGINIGGDSIVVVDKCRLSNDGGNCIGKSGTGVGVVQNCEITNPSSNSSNFIHNSAGLLIVKNSLFQDSAESNAYDLYITGGEAVILGNVFYNAYRVARIDTTAALFQNNIVHTASWFGYTLQHNAYLNNQANGYNYFYDVDTIFYDTDDGAGSTQKQSSDVSGVDPGFLDAANGDFRLKTTSPCLNTGKPTAENGKSTIGLWGPRVVEPSNYMRGRPIMIDIYD